MDEKSIEEKILLAVAKANGILKSATVKVMAHDTSDGLRLSKYLDDHTALLLKMSEELRSYGFIGDACVEEAYKIAKLNNQ